ncbi:MAG: aspartate aminotransferase family protein [Candidatus Heimdallarchaeota archaeon]
MGLEEAIKEYISKRPKSKALYEKAIKVIPGGTSHNLRLWGLPSLGAFPYYAVRGKGAKVWDVDGHEYIDYWQGHWVNILGHGNEQVAAAIKKALQLGPHLGLVTEAEVKLAELIVEIVPCVEQVKFGTSGTEGCMYAVRIARAYTKRKTIIKMEGGWHGPSTDLCWAVHLPYTNEVGLPVPDSAGLPDTMNVITIPFNDPDIAKQVIREHANDLAGVILEPLLGAGGIVPAESGYLEVLREETENIGACLIFDEIVTGFNLALGGAQEYFGVVPDLVVLGKTMAGGVHISAVGGPEKIMEVTNPLKPGEKYSVVTMGGGTFSSHLISLLAAYETLSILKEKKDQIYPQLQTFGDRLRSRIREEIIPNTSLILKCTGAVGGIGLHFMTKDIPPINAENIEGNLHKEQQKEYFVRMLNQGIHTMHGVGRLCTEHGESEIETTIDAIDTVVKAIERSS